MTLTGQDQTAEVPFGRLARIRTFHPRRGRLSERHLDALDRLWPRYGLTIAPGPPLIPAQATPRPAIPLPPGVPRVGPPPADMSESDRPPAGVAPPDAPPYALSCPSPEAPPLDLTALFGRRAPVVLEIGSGMGDATLAMAAADPDRDYLAVEVHTPGIANLLAGVERLELTNVRVARGDALDLVRDLLAPDRLDAVLIFFPDPWPKPRHHKRRLIQPVHVALLRSRLVPGGTLHCATDWTEYAEAMLQTLTADPHLINAYQNYAPRPPHRPITKFERRALTANRPVHDLIFQRR